MKLSLQAICPYFAMFPESFVREKVIAYSRREDWVFDPFCGRGTTILESLLLGRHAVGSDINPVAYCVSGAKAVRPTLCEVQKRIDELESCYNRSGFDIGEMNRLSLPPFFRRAFYSTTLRELLFLREALDWKSNRTDRFISALVLGSLHGEMDRSTAYFSNQMPRTICLKPDYSLRYWKERRLFPKKRKVFPMLREKAVYRLENVPQGTFGAVKMVDARRASAQFRSLRGKVSLVITSPPYLNVTRYEEDQWLRLWFLGGEPRPTYGKISKDDRHNTGRKYWQFLSESWNGIKSLMKSSAIMVIRLGAIGIEEKEMTLKLQESIQCVFPKARLVTPPDRSELVRRQTASFQPRSGGCIYEMDYVFSV